MENPLTPPEPTPIFDRLPAWGNAETQMDDMPASDSGLRVFLLGSPRDWVAKVFYNRCAQAGHSVRFFENLEGFEPDSDEPVPPEERPHVVLTCQHDTFEYLSLGEFFHFMPLAEDGILLMSALGTTGYDAPLPVNAEESRLVMFSPLAFFTERYQVEMAPALNTAPDATRAAQQFFASVGLQTHVLKDSPGFIFPRVFACLVNEACFALMEGVATAEAIDTAMTLGTRYPQGPLRWADKVGLDVVLNILNNLYAEYTEERYRPCRLLKEKVLSDHLGMKTGQGFYRYADVPYQRESSRLLGDF